MHYVILKKRKNGNYSVEEIIKCPRQGQVRAINEIKKEFKKGSFIIMPMCHATLFDVSNHKVVSKFKWIQKKV